MGWGAFYEVGGLFLTLLPPPQPAEEAAEEPGSWEETFKTHTDSKPNGEGGAGGP